MEYQSYSENVFEQKLEILTKLTKKFWNLENFENFQKMRQSLVRQSLAKDCIFVWYVGRDIFEFLRNNCFGYKYTIPKSNTKCVNLWCVNLWRTTVLCLNNRSQFASLEDDFGDPNELLEALKSHLTAFPPICIKMHISPQYRASLFTQSCFN